MPVILKGADLANSINKNTQTLVQALKKAGIDPTLSVITITPNNSDLAYQNTIKKECSAMGITLNVTNMPPHTSTTQLCEQIEQINKNNSIHGCLLFQPMPKNIDINKIRTLLKPQKDVDGITLISLSAVFIGVLDNNSGFAPCTAQACIDILDYYNIKITGKHIVVIGRSLVVGRPVALLLSNRRATVTICHSKTQNLANICRNADIIISAAGVAKLVDKTFLSKNQVILDVGINIVANGKICGDVDYETALNYVEAITPVPGGVGTVTTAVLLNNVAIAAKNLVKKEGI